MFRSGTRLACVVAALLSACTVGEAPNMTEPVAEVPPAAPRADTARPRLAATLDAWMAKDFVTPPAREQKCDDAGWREPPSAGRRLVLGVRDARFEKKNLLPLDLTGRLTEPNLHALRQELALSPKGRPLDASLGARVEALDARRFALVFHVTEHFGAERVFRKDRSRWEWMPGTLVAWLAVHDAGSGKALCQTLLVVKNDVKGASVAARLKSDTRERLTRELGRDVRAEAKRALTRITSALELPEPEAGPSAARR
jgi:hypothetical protein